MATVFKVLPTTQQYDWGTIGHSSKVAQYAAACKLPGFTLDENTPYAELWMGTHHTSPSRLLDSEKLSDHLAAHPELMGARVVERFRAAGAAEGNLPFLFKVLAIGKALSIQTHPDKAMAEKLHQERPDVYKDANHKPEMALALTPFQAMCGFLPLPRIAAYLSAVPEFAALVPPAIAAQFAAAASSADPRGPAEKAALKDVFAAVMTADAALFQPQLERLVRRYENGEVHDVERDVQELVVRLHSQFPGDIGVFCAFVLNHLTLKPGEAIFLAAGEPHAYVAGDIVECMATSDNVIRAGLTPKLRDVPNLVAGLTYNAAPASKHLVQPSTFAPGAQHSTLYDPPIPEFSIVRTELAAGAREAHRAVDGPSVAIVTEGAGAVTWGGGERLAVAEGEAFFVGAGQEVGVEAGAKRLVVHRAFVEAK
ncbi:mannos-6-phosphate isomerase [Trametes versicolor FP-101664 SS1]|uniref:mannos-6-phosphate isomerase n=1 Tax=Trametes versicolor (strain FP-101664) TaxID=717944 RepID=UPI00046215FB|nr:mannos-6-phosphate isomerase [Trametes versicolor FP-101664 SS1]EIW55798.1 mannos-6-phosphate isomerase [Trametes versicolor FP-101664 SS1]